MNEEERKAAMIEHQRSDDFKAIMATEGGRRIIWWMLQECQVFRAFPRESHAEMAYLEGRRNNGLMLLARIQNDCPQYHQPMITENTVKSEKEE